MPYRRNELLEPGFQKDFLKSNKSVKKVTIFKNKVNMGIHITNENMHLLTL